MDEPLDEQYLRWLYTQVASTRPVSTTKTFWSLFRHLYCKEFVWLVSNDDNRVEDGRDLRYEFLEESDFRGVDPNWMGLGCSVLELLIGLARRASFEDDKPVATWFWRFIHNLGLQFQNDQRYSHDYTEDVINSFIFRNYEPNGRGGLFPLRGEHPDQRKVEIWYQLCAYIIERE